MALIPPSKSRASASPHHLVFTDGATGLQKCSVLANHINQIIRCANLLGLRREGVRSVLNLLLPARLCHRILHRHARSRFPFQLPVRWGEKALLIGCPRRILPLYVPRDLTASDLSDASTAVMTRRPTPYALARVRRVFWLARSGTSISDSQRTHRHTIERKVPQSEQRTATYYRSTIGVGLEQATGLIATDMISLQRAQESRSSQPLLPNCVLAGTRRRMFHLSKHSMIKWRGS
jgi:hypothetical protein